MSDMTKQEAMAAIAKHIEAACRHEGEGGGKAALKEAERIADEHCIGILVSEDTCRELVPAGLWFDEGGQWGPDRAEAYDPREGWTSSAWCVYGCEPGDWVEV